jgi:hypothetical protein
MTEAIGAVIGWAIVLPIMAIPIALLSTLALRCSRLAVAQVDALHQERSDRLATRHPAHMQKGNAMTISMPHPSRWSRRRKVLSGTVGFVLAAFIGVALALFLTRGSIGGDGSIREAEAAPLTVNAMTVAGATDDGFTCTASATDGVGTISFQDAVAGVSACSINVTVSHPDGADFGLRLSDARWVPQYVTAQIGPTTGGGSFGCGSSLGNGTQHTFQLHLTARADAPLAGATFTADPDLDGVYAQTDPTGCPSV